MQLDNKDLSNIVMLLDRVETKGIGEAYVLAGLHNKLTAMLENDQAKEEIPETEDQKGKKSQKA